MNLILKNRRQLQNLSNAQSIRETIISSTNNQQVPESGKIGRIGDSISQQNKISEIPSEYWSIQEESFDMSERQSEDKEGNSVIVYREKQKRSDLVEKESDFKIIVTPCAS